MSRFAAMLDACSLVPIALADTLLRLAECGIYRPLWNERILAEMVSAIAEIHPHLAEHGERRAATMRDFFADATVSGWAPLEASLSLPDPDDRHVVAAAIIGRADVIVTANTKDFPAAVLDQFGIEVQTPDRFLLNQLDLDPGLVMSVLAEQAGATRRPAITLAVLLERLAACGVGGFAAEASKHRWRISRG